MRGTPFGSRSRAGGVVQYPPTESREARNRPVRMSAEAKGDALADAVDCAIKEVHHRNPKGQRFFFACIR